MRESVDGACRGKGWKLGRKGWLKAAGAVVLAVVLVMAGRLLVPSDKTVWRQGQEKSAESCFLFYVKNGTVYGVDTNDRESRPRELTSRIYSATSPYRNFENYQSWLQDIKVSPEQKYIYYINQVKKESGNLCRVAVEGADKTWGESETLASNVLSYALAGEGAVVYQEYSGSHRLYFHNLTKEEQLGSDVNEYCVSEDGSGVLWRTYKGDLFYRRLEMGAEPMMLDSGMTTSLFATNDLNTVYYGKKDVIMCIKDLEHKEEVASGANIYFVFDGGSGLYYYKTPNRFMSASALVEDDMAKADGLLGGPVPSSGSDAGDSDGYPGREERNKLRQELQEKNLYDICGIYDIYAYDSRGNRLVAKDVYWTESMFGWSGTLYAAYPVGRVEPQIRLSEIKTGSDAFELASKALRRADQGILLADGDAVPFPYEENNQYFGDLKNRILYTAETAYGPREGQTEYVRVSSAKFTETKLLEPEEIVTGPCYLLLDSYSADKSGKFVYYRDYDGVTQRGILSCNGKTIADNVYLYATRGDVFYYLTDGNEEFTSGTLMRYEKGKKQELAKDVAAFSILDNGKIVALTGFANAYSGYLELIEGDTGESRVLDSGVKCFDLEMKKYQ